MLHSPSIINIQANILTQITIFCFTKYVKIKRGNTKIWIWNVINFLVWLSLWWWWYIYDACLSAETALLHTQSARCTKSEGISVSGSCHTRAAMTFACLSAHWTNKGRKVLCNELCKCQTVHLQLSEQTNASYTRLCCHRRVDTLNCKKCVQSVQSKNF